MGHDKRSNVVPITPGTPRIEETAHKMADRLPNSPNEPPRRLSMDTRSKFHSPWHCRRALVKLDGEVVRRCFEFDLDEGWVRAVVEDANGDPVATNDGQALRQEVRHGQVSVEYVRGNRFF